ncbi:hypothetical protein NQ318_021946 [Aromia moschata]|uniref:Uncharacterized protein n=1 Tax=Aromia moschata TaxID=1265417 RepID=A0AAV8XVS7_9CUCU|nr:hypothetical protein NQ318_021946 [Aromia moschata]
MKVLIIIAFISCLSVEFAASLTPADPIIPIISQDQDVSFDGSYRTAFESANGIRFQEQGVLKNPGNKDAEAEEVQGVVSYKAPDGTPIQLSYLANENGFQPQGAHLPVAPVDDNTPPPIPLAILRSLEYNAAHPEPKPFRR